MHFTPQLCRLGVAAVNEPEILPGGCARCEFGARVKIVEPCNLYGCKIGDDCFIGPFTEIQKRVRVGARTRVQSHGFICELVTIGEDCFVGHGVMFINDTFSTGGPARGRKELWRETVIGNRVSIGSNATIMPVEIVDDVVIGAGAVVTRDITARRDLCRAIRRANCPSVTAQITKGIDAGAFRRSASPISEHQERDRRRDRRRHP